MRKDWKPPQESAGKWCRAWNPPRIRWRQACNCFLYFLYFHQMRIYYFATTKDQMKGLIFKQPTFYKNQIGTRSQLCNWWNHRQNQLIRWKARAGWLAPKIFKPTQAQRLWRGAEITAKLKLWALSGVPPVCKPIFSSKLLQCIRLFLFLHSFRNWESTPLGGHISQCRGHKKSGITNDRKLIKNKRMWWIQGTSGCDLAGALALNTQHTHFGWCHNPNINKSSQTITSWTMELLLHTRSCLPLLKRWSNHRKQLGLLISPTDPQHLSIASISESCCVRMFGF